MTCSAKCTDSRQVIIESSWLADPSGGVWLYNAFIAIGRVQNRRDRMIKSGKLLATTAMRGNCLQLTACCLLPSAFNLRTGAINN